MFHDKEESVGGLNSLVQLDNVRVPHDLQNVDLSADSLHVVHVGDLALVEYFYRDLFVIQYQKANAHLPSS